MKTNKEVWKMIKTKKLNVPRLHGNISNLYLSISIGLFIIALSTSYTLKAQTNTAYGLDALKVNKGSWNSAFGVGSLFSNTTGSGNTADGVGALLISTIGDGNTASGMYALRRNITGYYNTALGYDADVKFNTLNYATAIGAYATVSESNTIQLGNDSVTKVFAGVGKNATLIAGGLQITGGAPAAGKILTSDATGVATWQNPMSGVTGWSLTGTAGTIDGTHFIGTTDNVPFNIRINNQKAGRIDASNTFYGYQSGNNLTTGGFNTAGGYQALYTNTTGDGNTAIGREAMKQNNTGNNNTAIGSLALNSNTSGNFNTAVGYNADVDEKLTNATALGHAAWVDESNKIVLGNTGVKTIGGYANWSNLSDARFKKNIQQDVHGLDFITKLNPITYNLDIKKLNSFLGVDERNAKRQQQPSLQQAQAIATKEAIRYTGFLAQEVEQAAQAVNYNFSGVIKPASDKGHYNMSYSDFVVPLVKAVQEQQAQIEEQKQLIEQMQKEKEVQQQINQQLQQRLEALEKILANNGKNTIAAPKTSSEAVSSQELHLYPNPTSGVFTVTAEHINSGVIEVHNMAGNLIKQLPVKSKLVNYVLDFSGYAKGSYIVTVSAGGKKYTKQVVVQ